MELKKFDKKEITRKLLPEFSGEFMNTIYRMFSKDDADIFTDRMYLLLFNDLQNLTNKICKKQRMNCAIAWKNGQDYDTYNKILNAEQPKIEEL